MSPKAPMRSIQKKAPSTTHSQTPTQKSPFCSLITATRDRDTTHSTLHTCTCTRLQSLLRPKLYKGQKSPAPSNPWRPRRCPQAGCTLRAIGAIKRIRTTIRGRRTRTFLGSADMAMDRQDQRSRAWRGRRCGRRTRMLRDRGSSRAWTGVRGGRIGGHDAKRRASVRQG